MMRLFAFAVVASVALAGCKAPAPTEAKKPAEPERPGLSVTVYESGLHAIGAFDGKALAK